MPCYLYLISLLLEFPFHLSLFFVTCLIPLLYISLPCYFVFYSLITCTTLPLLLCLIPSHLYYLFLSFLTLLPLGGSDAQLSAWLINKLDIKKQQGANQPASDLPLHRCVRYRIQVGLNVQIKAAFGLPGLFVFLYSFISYMFDRSKNR